MPIVLQEGNPGQGRGSHWPKVTALGSPPGAGLGSGCRGTKAGEPEPSRPFPASCLALSAVSLFLSFLPSSWSQPSPFSSLSRHPSPFWLFPVDSVSAPPPPPSPHPAGHSSRKVMSSPKGGLHALSPGPFPRACRPSGGSWDTWMGHLGHMTLKDTYRLGGRGRTGLERHWVPW